MYIKKAEMLCDKEGNKYSSLKIKEANSKHRF